MELGINVEKIKAEGLVLDLEVMPAALPILLEMMDSDECSFPVPIKVHLRAFRLQEMVEVEGKVETGVRFSCSRCLKEFETPVEEDFAVTFTRQLPEVEAENGEGAELTAEDMGLILFAGEEIDLTETIQEQVVMALPVRPLCRDDCKGLCSRCGADLNRGDCGCDRGGFNIKFSALKDFKIKKK